MSKSAHIIVSGRVQGVGFRWFVQSEAQKIGLSGSTKNLSDGTVEVYADGEEDQIDRLKTSLWEGNTVSNVTDVKLEWIEPRQISNIFEILF